MHGILQEKMDRQQRSRGEEVVAAAKKCLVDSPHPVIRKIECQYHDGVLVLRGRVSTYFHKQMAQEAVSSLDSIDEVLNEIQVSR